MYHLQSMPGRLANDATPPHDAERLDIGTLLRTTREGKARSLESCAQSLRMEIGDLRALEANAFESLPGGGITISWLRRYARLLGLNPELLAATYHAQHHVEARSFRSERTTVIRRKSRHGRRRMLRTFGFMVVMVLALMVLVMAALPQAAVRVGL
jgi:cytoskeleton protein RodZ